MSKFPGSVTTLYCTNKEKHNSLMFLFVSDSNDFNSSGGLTAALCAITLLYDGEQLVCESVLHNSNMKWKMIWIETASLPGYTLSV